MRKGETEKMKTLNVVSLRQPTDSNTSLPNSTDQPPISAARAEYAAQRARLLFGCYRKGGANDPETYVLAVTAVLAEYSEEVMRRVTDPREGLPRRTKWMPNPAKVAEACDAAVKTIAAEEHVRANGYEWNGQRWEKIGE